MWPPEPIYFNNILDAYADRQRANEPMHREQKIIDIYEEDVICTNPNSKSYNLLKKMDAESDEEEEEWKHIKGSQELLKEALLDETLEIDSTKREQQLHEERMRAEKNAAEAQQAQEDFEYGHDVAMFNTNYGKETENDDKKAGKHAVRVWNT